jgi:hypothetical protein
LPSSGPGIDIGLVAAEQIAAFRFVSLDGTGRVYPSGGSSDEMVVGVSENPASLGEACAVTFTGVAKVETATRIDAGAPVSSDGEGRAMSWLDSLSPVLAVALTDSGGSGEIIRVLVTLRPTPIIDGEFIAVDADRFPAPA